MCVLLCKQWGTLLQRIDKCDIESKGFFIYNASNLSQVMTGVQRVGGKTGMSLSFDKKYK